MFVVAMSCVTLCGAAQKATVERMEMTPTDLSASKYPRLDNNGEPCALVRVEVLADDVEFLGNVMQPVEHKTGDYWVYMLGGSKMLQIKSRSFLPLMINFADYGIDALLPKVTYAITLTLPSAPQRSAAAGMNYLVMSVSPANARVTVDGKEREVRDGTAKIMLRNGTYSYHVEAPGHLPEDGEVTVSGARVEKSVSLRSTKGTLAVTSTTPATEIYVNGERMGTGSWSGDLLPDSYLVEGRHPSYRTAEQMVNVLTGETATVNLPALTPITGALNIDYEPVGATVTIDGTSRGVTPTVVDGLLIGSHNVTIAATGYTPQTLTPTVTDSEITTLSGKLAAETGAPATSSPAATRTGFRRFKNYNGKYGFKDENGNVVIPAKYDGAEDFSDGLAAVKVNYKWGFIDKNGNMVIPTQYIIVLGFTEGLTGVKVNDKWGFIDKNDKMVIPAKYDIINRFSEGLSCVKINGKYGFIDKNDNMVIPATYDLAGWKFSEGLVPVQVNGKYGFIDKNENFRIPPKYDYASPFSDGLSAVRYNNNKYVFIDKNGNIAIHADYDNTRSFSEGLAAVKVGGKWGFIDKNGNLVIPAIYTWAFDFSNGVASVGINARDAWIDRNGNEVGNPILQ